MNYKETLEFLFSALPMFQREGNSAYKKDLNNIKALCEGLDNPQNKFKSIHVAGTNGKGSVSHILSAALQIEGYKVGLYTSPHLKDFRERIRLNGICISEEEVIHFVERITPQIEKIRPSFFEITVAMAFDYFARQKVNIAIIETGLGGRLDSTNIISPILSIITNISLDHTEMLGNTLEEIAEEKAGIIKNNTPFIVGNVNTECDKVFESHSQKKKAKYYKAWLMPNTLEYNPTDLRGNYQRENINLTKIAIAILNPLIRVSIQSWRKGLLNVKGLTGLRGRWDILQPSSPRIICDTGHNEAGLKSVIKSLEQEEYDTLHFVLGVVKEKDLNLLNLLPKHATYYFCKPNVIRGLDENNLRNEAESRGLVGKAFPTVSKAFIEAKSKAKQNDLIFIGGSTFVVAEVI